MNNRGPKFGVRHLQWIFLFWHKAISYSMRYNLSVAIVSMTEQTSSNPDIPVYHWNNKNVVLSSFFWGYIILQIPAGDLGRRFGAKRLLLLTMLTNSTMAVLIPVVAEKLGPEGVMVCRIIQGLSQGTLYPLISNLLGKWTPIQERSTIGSVIFSETCSVVRTVHILYKAGTFATYMKQEMFVPGTTCVNRELSAGWGLLTGATLGLVVTYPITGYLSESSFGWPMSFYVFGVLGFIWSVWYFIFGSEDPASHKTITQEERIYIEQSVGPTVESYVRTPWKEILTSLPVWTIILTSLGHGWGTATVITEMPTYFDKVLKFNISSNGILSSLPYLVSFFLAFVMGFLSDYIINKEYLSILNTRKLFTAIGSMGPGILLLIFAYLPENVDKYVAVAFLVGAVGIHSAVSAGYNINHYDLSPNFSGTLMGLINEAEELLSMVTPLAVQFVVTNETDRNQWRIIIGIGSVMFFTAAAVFGKFASADIQWWNEVEKDLSKV